MTLIVTLLVFCCAGIVGAVVADRRRYQAYVDFLDRQRGMSCIHCHRLVGYSPILLCPFCEKRN